MAFTQGNSVNDNETAWSTTKRNSQHLTPAYSTGRPPSIVFTDSPSVSDIHRGSTSVFKFPPSTLNQPQNGDVNNQYDVAKTASHNSLSDNETFDYHIQKSMLSLGLMALSSLVLSVVSIFFLFRLSAMQSVPPPSNKISINQPDNVYHRHRLVTGSIYLNFLDVIIALTSFVLMLNLCCLMVSCMQCFYVAKILKLLQGQERAFIFLKECNNSRFLAATGLFLSIPIIIVEIILYLLMEFDMVSAIIGAVLLAIGMIFCLFSMVHDTYFWWQTKKMAKDEQNIYDRVNDHRKLKNELSTLV